MPRPPVGSGHERAAGHRRRRRLAVARDANRANWDERAGLHEVAYGIERCAEDPAYLSTVVSDDLPVLAAHLPQGSLRGLDVVHLQCHIGTDTISKP